MVLFPFRTSLVGVPLLIHPLVRLSSLRIPVVPKQSWGWALTLCHLQFTPHGHPKAPSLTLTSTYMLLLPPITQNESLSDNVQITPQAVSLRVRPGETGRNEWTPQFVSPYTQFFERRRCTTLLAIHISRVSLWSVLYAHTHICTYVHGNVVQSRCPPYSQCTHPSLCFYVCSYCIVKQGCITAYL